MASTQKIIGIIGIVITIIVLIVSWVLLGMGYKSCDTTKTTTEQETCAKSKSNMKIAGWILCPLCLICMIGCIFVAVKGGKSESPY